jgi:hypothetical protein
MATSQAQARLVSSSAKGGGRTRRTSARLSEREDESADERGKGVNGYRHTSGGRRKEQQSTKEERSKKRKAGEFAFFDGFCYCYFRGRVKLM